MRCSSVSFLTVNKTPSSALNPSLMVAWFHRHYQPEARAGRIHRQSSTPKEIDMNEAQFKQQLQEQGYGAAEPLEWEADMAKEMHVHDFSASVLVLKGAFTMVTEDGSVTHQPGDTCKLAAGTLHAEQTGADGATILIGKK
jgi:quercetin dioxygenase-like cupin family protein